MIKDFGSTAEKLSGNPLGIIALFIVLLYGIAGFVLGTSVGTLASDERKILIWFLVIFPFIVLIVFAWLVSQHHTKLYAPKDFSSDDTFLKALSPQQIEERRQKEIEAYKEELAATPSHLETSSRLNKSRPSKQSSFIQDLRLADDLAMKYVKSKYKIDLLGNQELRRGNDGIQIDGIAISNQNIEAFEFQLISAETINKNLNNRMANIAHTAMKLASYSGNTKTKLIYVVLVKGLTDEVKGRIERAFKTFSPSSPIPLEIDIVSFEELKGKYEQVSEIA